MRIRTQRSPRRRTAIRACIALITAAAIGVVPLAAHAVPTRDLLAQTTASASTPPTIERTVSASGFQHPGIGLTADHLENMRTQVAAGVEPWASYYAAMVQTGYASPAYKAENQGASDQTPVSDSYNNSGMSGRALRDSKGALTQALQYVVTGDETYRANALHVIRTWSSMDPSKFAYFPDAHIHTGVPLYQLLIAAEIIRSTTPRNNELNGYDLTWTQQDQERIEANLIDPVVSTFLYSQSRLWNQHLYGEIGALAAAIFTDDSDLYAQRVEWFSVNSTFEPVIDINGGDVNGALASLVRVIDADDPLNGTGEQFTQVMEMGRDQAHAEGDIVLLGSIARLIHNQGTLLDPSAGTVSTAPDAVSPYAFLDERILDGADVFAAFMIGEDVPYVDTSGGSGKVSQAYRGRINNSVSEIYYQYQYVAGIDVAEQAPYVRELYEHRDGPLSYSGTGVENFWAERGTDFTGAEYWVAFPPELADEDVDVPALQDGPELDVDHVGHLVGPGITRGTDPDGTGYVTLDDPEGDGQLAVRRAVWSDRSKTALVGIRVRTVGTAVITVAPTSSPDNELAIQLPDTGGQWRYITFDISAKARPVAPVGGNIVYIRAVSGANVDVASVRAQANGVLTPATFADGSAITLHAVAGEPLSRDLGVSASGNGAPSVALQDAPPGAALSDDGVLTWQPSAGDVGTHRLVAVVSDDLTDATLTVTVVVAEDRDAAIAALVSDIQPESTYTTSSWKNFATAREAAVDGVGDASDSAFAELLDALRVAVEDLSALNPELSDGTLDYSSIATSPQISATVLALLVDGDNQSTWGDQRVPAVVLDFGPGYRVRADAFGFLARDTFASRAEGTNVYGSDDGETWTLLTEHANSGDDSQIEIVQVSEGERQSRYRFLRLQLDSPGTPTDPAYPGIWTLADFRIDGERSEAVGSLDSVAVSAPGATAGRVVAGDTVKLKIAGDPSNTDLHVSMLGATAEVTTDGPGSWTAAAAIPDTVERGGPVTFAINFTTPDGRQADPVRATTDGSKLYVSTDQNRVDNLLAEAAKLSPDGAPSASGAVDTARMLDGDAASQSDTRAVGGVYALTWDFGAGAGVSVTGADLLLRQDGYGISRISDMRLEASDDLTTWTRLTPRVPTGTLDWQNWAVADTTSHRYLRLVNGNIIGVAELRLFGTRTLNLDALLEQAQQAELQAYSRASAIAFSRELSAVEEIRDEPGADLQALAQRVLDAWNLLVPALVEPATIEQPWVTASTKSWDGTRDAAANGWSMFDGDATTFTDTTSAAGWVQVVPGQNASFTVETVRFLPRPGFASRATGMQFQGSHDGGATWSTFATAGTVTTDSWNEIDLTSAVTYEALRVLAPAGNTNLAEVQFVQSVVDTTGLQLYLAEADTLAEEDWTRESWATLTEARSAARHLLDEPSATQSDVDAAADVLAGAIASLVAAVPGGTTSEIPGRGVLTSDNGWDTGLLDGAFNVTMNLWWGPNATRVTLYEDGVKAGSRDLIDATPQAQTVVFPIAGKKNGTYVYTAVLANRNGESTTQPLTVAVKDASPAKGGLAYDAESRAMGMDLWWGTNAHTYRLYEDGVLIDTQSLSDSTPAAQHAVTDLSGRASGLHVYHAELENAAGVTTTDTLSVTLL